MKKLSLFSDLTDKELKKQFKDLKLSENKNDKTLIDALAIASEVSNRTLKMRPYFVQLLGAITLFNGNIAEMKTGEGKTLTSALAIVAFSAFNRKVHVVTTNEYLSKRDAEELSKIYDFLGITIGLNSVKKTTQQKQEAYRCDVLYTTNDEVGFDYLRDNTTYDRNAVVQKELDVVLIDEIDSVLIDSSKTPLIIAIESNNNNYIYLIQAQSFCSKLNVDDYDINKENKTVHLTDSGLEKANHFFKVNNILSKDNIEKMHFIANALKANFVFKRDDDYAIKKGKVEIIDTFTGRISEGRRYSDGLHQAIEAKENVEIQSETETKAMITYQNYFRLYKTICGMSGTAKNEEFEFNSIYNTKVIQIPTNRPIARIDRPDEFFETKEEKMDYLVQLVETNHKLYNRPILIGTQSVEESHEISKRLKHIPHHVLNAVKNEKEDDIIKQAGRIGAITISTNMAGRGTDIKLEDTDDPNHSLLVISTQHNISPRIDDQLKGRSGRQGNSGDSVFLVSLDDELFRKYADKKLIRKMQFLIEHHMYGLASKKIQALQRYVEAKEQDSRQSSLRYDIIIGKQRASVYQLRKNILEDDNYLRLFADKSYDNASKRILKNVNAMKKDKELLNERLSQMYFDEFESINHLKNEFNRKKLALTKHLKDKTVRDSFRRFVIKTIDFYFEKQIILMENSKHYTSVRTSAQLNPMMEFQKNSIILFKKMIEDIENNIIFYINKFITEAGVDDE